MTTIAYDHKNGLIAVDGRATSGGTIKTDTYQKWTVANGATWFMAGCVCDQAAFIEAFSTGKVIVDLGYEPEVDALVVEDGVVTLRGISNKGQCWMETPCCNEAIGSGQYWALAAMDFGCNAGEAVRYAATKDCDTGGRITVLDIKTGKMKKLRG